MKEGSNLVSKRRKALIKGQNRRFSTERIAQQHDHEIDRIIGSKAGTGKLHMLFKSGDDPSLGENVSHDGDFLEYVIMPPFLIVWYVGLDIVARCLVVFHHLPSQGFSRACFCPGARL